MTSYTAFTCRSVNSISTRVTTATAATSNKERVGAAVVSADPNMRATTTAGCVAPACSLLSD